MNDSSKLTLRLNRTWLTDSSTDKLVRLAKFLECPLWEHLSEGERRHNLINAIQRVEKSLALGRAHPYKKNITTISLEEKDSND